MNSAQMPPEPLRLRLAILCIGLVLGAGSHHVTHVVSTNEPPTTEPCVCNCTTEPCKLAHETPQGRDLCACPPCVCFDGKRMLAEPCNDEQHEGDTVWSIQP